MIENTFTNFDLAFERFFNGLIDLQNDRFDKAGYQRKTYTYTMGKKYIRIVENDGSAFAFIDRTNGSVLKPASWKAPARHARGNIFDKTSGLGSIGMYGPAYLRG